LQNNKTEQTTAALYMDSFATRPQKEMNDWETEYEFPNIDSMTPVSLPTQHSSTYPTHAIDPSLQFPNINSISLPTTQHSSPTYPTHAIDPSLQYVGSNSAPGVPTSPYPTYSPPSGAPTSSIGLSTPDFIPVNPTHVNFPSGAPTPFIGLSTPDSFSGMPTNTGTQVNSPFTFPYPTYSPPSGAPTSSIGLSTPDFIPVNPTHVNFPSGAPTPFIGLSTPDSFSGMPTNTGTQVEQSTPDAFPSVPTTTPFNRAHVPNYIFPSEVPTPHPEQSCPRSRPVPREKTKNPTVSSQDPNPTTQQEEELGRPKRIQKRKVDIYLEAELKLAELAAKKKQKKKWTFILVCQKKIAMPKNI
jgi:hypothetical protein